MNAGHMLSLAITLSFSVRESTGPLTHDEGRWPDEGECRTRSYEEAGADASSKGDELDMSAFEATVRLCVASFFFANVIG